MGIEQYATSLISDARKRKKDDSKNDFFSAQNTNNCLIRLLKHYDSSKIIISSVIDNLLKGASGQAVQCMNLMFDLKDSKGLENLKSV